MRIYPRYPRKSEKWKKEREIRNLTKNVMLAYGILFGIPASALTIVAIVMIFKGSMEDFELFQQILVIPLIWAAWGAVMLFIWLYMLAHEVSELRKLSKKTEAQVVQEKRESEEWYKEMTDLVPEGEVQPEDCVRILKGTYDFYDKKIREAVDHATEGQPLKRMLARRMIRLGTIMAPIFLFCKTLGKMAVRWLTGWDWFGLAGISKKEHDNFEMMLPVILLATAVSIVTVAVMVRSSRKDRKEDEEYEESERRRNNVQDQETEW